MRGSALIALEGLSRAHPGDVNAYRPLLHELASRDPNVAVRRLAIVCFKNGTPARETIVILDGIAADDEADAEVRKTARSVVAAARQEVEQEVAAWREQPLVGLIMGSRSDWETMRHAAETLDGARRAVRAARRLRPPHARPPLRVRGLGRGARPPGDDRRRRRRGAPARDGGGEDGAAVLGVPVESKALNGIDSLLSIVQMPAGVPVGTLAIGRAGRRQRRAARGVDPRARATRASASGSPRSGRAQTQSVLDAPDPGGVSAPRDARRLHRRRPARPHARARRAPARARASASSTRRRTRRRRRSASWSSAPSTTRRPSHASPPAPTSSRTSSRTSRSRRRAGSPPCRRRARSSWARTAWSRSELFQRLGIPTRALRLARRTGAACARQVAAARLRRQGPAAAADAEEPIGERRAGRGARRLRARALDHRRPRARRRDALLAARGERAPRGNPPRLAGAGRRAHRKREAEAARATAARRARATSAFSRSSCSRSAAGCSRTSSRLASTTRATGRSTAPSRVSSRTTCGRFSVSRSGRPPQPRRR